MVFYKIKFLSFPKIEFAVTARTDQYKNVIQYREDMIEFSVNDNDIEIEEDGKITYWKGKRFSLVMPDMCYKAKAVGSAVSYMSSVALRGTFEYERIECDNLQECRKIAMETKDALLLPRMMNLDLEYNNFENDLRKISLLFPKEGEANKMYALSMVFELIGKLDETFRKSLIGENKESICIYYSKKAKKYIEQNYRNKINIFDISNILGISPNYLSNIFKRETKQTITEYIAYVRLGKARELLYKEKKSYDEVATEVGLSSARNMNRLFQKYYGMSTQKCLLADKEISLYHRKPWEVKQLKDDIYEKTEEEY